MHIFAENLEDTIWEITSKITCHTSEPIKLPFFFYRRGLLYGLYRIAYMFRIPSFENLHIIECS